jgi:hypothetical protein
MSVGCSLLQAQVQRRRRSQVMATGDHRQPFFFSNGTNFNLSLRSLFVLISHVPRVYGTPRGEPFFRLRYGCQYVPPRGIERKMTSFFTEIFGGEIHY